VLRRLYSTFAGSWPGIGLLLMRGVVGAVLLLAAGLNLWHEPSLRIALSSASLALPGLLLVVGLWTPVAGAVIAVVEVSQILRVDEHPVVGLLTGTIAAGLAMLGPGRWSIDARLFGWRRIEAPLRKQ
jgi:putative oxidoreductase